MAMEPKKVNVQVIDEKESPGLYKVMRDLVKANHSHLQGARIVLVWNYGWAEDADGRIVLGRAKKASDLDAALGEYDFAISLNHETVNDAAWTEAQTAALIDHELTHCSVSKDAAGEIKTDETGRTVYRIRKHDIEEFREVIERHGLYKGDLVKFAETVREAKALPLLQTDLPGAVTLSTANQSVTLTAKQFDRASSEILRDPKGVVARVRRAAAQ